jgi:rhodanese-related sulfurtransferase
LDSRIFIFLCAIVSILALSTDSRAFHDTPPEWDSVKKTIQEDFPDVPQMSIEQLHELLSMPESEKPLLLDARDDEEYKVSHIQNAQRAPTEEEALAILKNSNKDRLIVIYCSVGYRSSSLAHKLISRGYTNVHNLEGSIFKWANEGQPVYCGKEKVQMVHPHNNKWGNLLKKEHRSILQVSD